MNISEKKQMKTWSYLQFWELLCVLCLSLLIKEKRWEARNGLVFPGGANGEELA